MSRTDDHAADGSGSRPNGSNRGASPLVHRLEQATGVVLGLALLAVLWILLAAAWPERFTTGNETLEATVLLVVLSAALALVTVVALLHTRANGDRH